MTFGGSSIEFMTSSNISMHGAGPVTVATESTAYLAGASGLHISTNAAAVAQAGGAFYSESGSHTVAESTGNLEIVATGNMTVDGAASLHVNTTNGSLEISSSNMVSIHGHELAEIESSSAVNIATGSTSVQMLANVQSLSAEAVLSSGSTAVKSPPLLSSPASATISAVAGTNIVMASGFTFGDNGLLNTGDVLIVDGYAHQVRSVHPNTTIAEVHGLWPFNINDAQFSYQKVAFSSISTGEDDVGCVVLNDGELHVGGAIRSATGSVSGLDISSWGGAVLVSSLNESKIVQLNGPSINFASDGDTASISIESDGVFVGGALEVSHQNLNVVTVNNSVQILASSGQTLSMSGSVTLDDSNHIRIGGGSASNREAHHGGQVQISAGAGQVDHGSVLLRDESGTAGLEITGGGDIVINAKDGQYVSLEQDEKHILSISDTGSVLVNSLAREADGAKAANVLVSGGKDPNLGGSVILRSGVVHDALNMTSSVSILASTAECTVSVCGGIHVDSDGFISVNSGSSKDIRIHSGSGMQQGGNVRISPGAGQDARVQVMDGVSNDTRISVSSGGAINLNSRSGMSAAGISIVAGMGLSGLGGSIALSAGSGLGTPGVVEIANAPGAGVFSVNSDGEIAVDAPATTSLYLNQSGITVLKASDHGVDLSAQDVFLRSSAAGNITLMPGLAGNVVLQNGHGDAVINSTGQGQLHIYRPLLFLEAALSISSQNGSHSVGIGTLTPTHEDLLEVAGTAGISDRLLISETF